MKLPRWLVVCMLATSVLAVVCAVVWWWVTWPERTAREFVARIEAGNFQAAAQMTRDGQWSAATSGIDLTSFLQTQLIFETRSPRDVLDGQVRFRVGSAPYQFAAERGRIMVTADGWSSVRWWDASTGAPITNVAGQTWTAQSSAQSVSQANWDAAARGAPTRDAKAR